VRPQAANESVDEILAELDAIIGQPGIKRQVRALLAQVQMGQDRGAAGLKVGNLAAHLVFSGPPGTGKTTIARLIARLYFALGILTSDKVVETGRSGLVG
jgi:MoxR-like ATPase